MSERTDGDRAMAIITSANERMLETSSLLAGVALYVGRLDAMSDAERERVKAAAPLLRSTFAWLEAQRDEADRAERAHWQDQIHNLGQAMAILRLPLTEE